MTIDAIRFRMEGALCVLQVMEYGEIDRYGYGNSRKASWRDAEATDLLDAAKFTTDHASLAQRVESIDSRLQQIELSPMAQGVQR